MPIITTAGAGFIRVRLACSLLRQGSLARDGTGPSFESIVPNDVRENPQAMTLSRS